MTQPISTTLIVKNLSYIPALLIGLSPESYLILTAFLGFDLILGVLRAVSIGGMQAFKSYKLAAGILSKFLVLTVPLVFVWSGRGAGFDFTIIGQWGVGALILAQAYSILGHINAIRAGEDKSEWDAVSWLILKLRKILEEVMKDSHSKP